MLPRKRLVRRKNHVASHEIEKPIKKSIFDEETEDDLDTDETTEIEDIRLRSPNKLFAVDMDTEGQVIASDSEGEIGQVNADIDTDSSLSDVPNDLNDMDDYDQLTPIQQAVRDVRRPRRTLRNHHDLHLKQAEEDETVDDDENLYFRKQRNIKVPFYVDDAASEGSEASVVSSEASLPQHTGQGGWIKDIKSDGSTDTDELDDEDYGEGISPPSSVADDEVQDPTYLEPEINTSGFGNCLTTERRLAEYQILPGKRIKHGPNKSMAIVYEPGSGKTLTGEYLINSLMSYELDLTPGKTPTKWIILAPASLVDQWKRELQSDHLCNVSSGTSHALRILHKYANYVKVMKQHEFLNDISEDEIRNSYVLVDEAHIYRFVKPNSDPDEEELKMNDDDVDPSQKNYVIGKIAKAKSCFLMTATPLWGNITEMATYLWMLQGRPQIPSVEDLMSVSDQIEQDFEMKNVAKRFKAIKAMWECYFLFYNASEPSSLTPKRKIHFRYARFSKAEDAAYVKATKERSPFLVKQTDACNCDTKLKDITNQCRRILTKYPEAKIVIASRNTQKENLTSKKPRLPKGIGKMIKELDAANIAYMDLTEGDNGPESIRPDIVKSFNQQETIIPLTKNGKRKKKNKMDITIHPQRIILIGPSTSVGVDFKGVTHMFLMEPSWHDAISEQQIGRAVRKNAHAHVKDKELKNVVRIYRMFGIRRQFPAARLQKVEWLNKFIQLVRKQPDISEETQLYRDYTSDQTIFGKSKEKLTDLYNYLDILKSIQLHDQCKGKRPSVAMTEEMIYLTDKKKRQKLKRSMRLRNENAVIQ